MVAVVVDVVGVVGVVDVVDRLMMWLMFVDRLMMLVYSVEDVVAGGSIDVDGASDEDLRVVVDVWPLLLMWLVCAVDDFGCFVRCCGGLCFCRCC